MPFYRDQVFPRLMNLMMDTKETRKARARVCSDLRGDVVEIGFGTGLNLPHMPSTVSRLRVVEPAELGVRLAQDRIAAAPVPVEIAGLDGHFLPFEDDSADAVLCTWTLCTIPDAVAAVREARRVLRPGGTFHFVEHGAAPDTAVRTWQNRLNGVQQRVACGCNLNRDIPALVAAGGLTIRRLDAYYTQGQPKMFGATSEGVAEAA
ncbi:MAG: class I SAM-dependent methyltransferase [Nocardioidaceae bacterium]|nr:class I SAM-dependent methyltransferase [Nocardioidaceae bacterium]